MKSSRSDNNTCLVEKVCEVVRLGEIFKIGQQHMFSEESV